MDEKLVVPNESCPEIVILSDTTSTAGVRVTLLTFGVESRLMNGR